MNHPDHRLAVLFQGHQAGVGRDSPQEGPRAVQGIHDPTAPALAVARSAFLAEKPVARKRRQQFRADQLLALPVDRGDR